MSVIDRKRALAAAGGDAAVARELLALLRADLPARLQSLRAAVDSGRLDAARAVAHKIKGAAAYCAATELQQRAAEMEAVDDDEVPATARRVSQAAERLLSPDPSG